MPRKPDIKSVQEALAHRDVAGQPTKYTPELADKICALIATHAFGLPTLCRKFDLPDASSIYNWLSVYPEFFNKYMKAKEHQAHVLAEQTIEIADNVPTFEDKEGNERIDAGMLGKAKLQVDNYRWAASTLAPRYFNKDREKQQSTTNEVHVDCIKRKQELDEKNKKDY